MNTTNNGVTKEPPLSDTGRCILDTFERVILLLEPIQQEKLLGMGMGIEFSKNPDKTA